MMYNNLASVYDKLMEDMPYVEWADFIEKIIEKEKIQVKNILDLGSGTGSISSLLSARGYQVTNLDFSQEMLDKAKEKYEISGVNGAFLNSDIRDIDFQEEYDCIISTFDTLNYFTEEDELENIFERVFKALRNQGLFLFDLNTLYKFEKILGKEIYTYNTEEIVYIWENEYNKNTEILEIDLSFFIKKEEDSYRRFNEYHVQKYYCPEKIEGMLKRSGFSVVRIFQDLEFKEPEDKGIRNFFAAIKG